MLIRLTIICLSGLILASAPWAEAAAKKKCATGSKFKCTTLGGTKVCSCWKTGSEICETETTGLDDFQGCVPGETCPVVTCTVFGTADQGNGMCDPDTPDPDCGIEGLSYCLAPGAQQSRLEKQPITLNAVFTDTSEITRCERSRTGRDGPPQRRGFTEGCTKSIELGPENCTDCCKSPASEFITFVAFKFNGVTCVCPGGYTNWGDCCADSERNEGYCENEGEEVCVVQQCTANLKNYTPGKSLPYTCVQLPNLMQQ